MVKFRFQDLEIWKNSLNVSDQIFDMADFLEKRHLFRWAEQLRGSTLSISNNIAEGSGALSRKEFIQYLNYARRSVFETANILVILTRRNLEISVDFDSIMDKLDHLSRQLTRFQKNLAKN
jgi:four helix bundle protein